MKQNKIWWPVINDFFPISYKFCGTITGREWDPAWIHFNMICSTTSTDKI